MEQVEEQETIKLISSEGHEFIVAKNAAMLSGTIKSMLSTPAEFSEKQTNEIRFSEIPTQVLEKVIEYFYFKLKYSNSTTEIPEFKIEPEIALELLMAANFLDA